MSNFTEGQRVRLNKSKGDPAVRSGAEGVVIVGGDMKCYVSFDAGYTWWIENNRLEPAFKFKVGDRARSLLGSGTLRGTVTAQPHGHIKLYTFKFDEGGVVVHRAEDELELVGPDPKVGDRVRALHTSLLIPKGSEGVVTSIHQHGDEPVYKVKFDREDQVDLFREVDLIEVIPASEPEPTREPEKGDTVKLTLGESVIHGTVYSNSIKDLIHVTPTGASTYNVFYKKDWSIEVIPPAGPSWDEQISELPNGAKLVDKKYPQYFLVKLGGAWFREHGHKIGDKPMESIWKIAE